MEINWQQFLSACKTVSETVKANPDIINQMQQFISQVPKTSEEELQSTAIQPQETNNEEQNKKIQPYIDRLNDDVTGYGYQEMLSINAILADKNLNSSDLAQIMKNTGISFSYAMKFNCVSPEQYRNYTNSINSRLSQMSGEEMVNFLNEYEGATGTSFTHDIRSFFSGSNESNYLKEFYSKFNDAIKNSGKLQDSPELALKRDSIKNQAKGENIVTTVLEQINSGALTKQEAISILYKQYGSADSIIDYFQASNPTQRDKYENQLEDLFKSILTKEQGE